ncbi:MAG: Mrp/NBP35 family ATP-binding protein [Chloroflexota bacterium]|nr:Mrp/NBP35 family ATP-binding protein [Chloroflexota bacterium]
MGKSTVSLNLALALRDRGAAVGILDADLYGPNIPLMVGLKRERWAGDWTIAGNRKGREEPRMEPIDCCGLKVMSAGFIIAEDQPLILDGATAYFLVKQMVERVDWGNLDYLVVDLPPGTADVQQSLVKLLPISGAILVVTPQDVAHLDGKKAVKMFQRAQVPLLGVVENMSGLICPHCQEPIEVFSRVPEERSIWSLEVENLGAIPLDPQVSADGDSGRPLLISHPESPQSQAFRVLAERVVHRLVNR